MNYRVCKGSYLFGGFWIYARINNLLDSGRHCTTSSAYVYFQRVRTYIYESSERAKKPGLFLSSESSARDAKRRARTASGEKKRTFSSAQGGGRGGGGVEREEREEREGEERGRHSGYVSAFPRSLPD
jgi:hypothetical protein